MVYHLPFDDDITFGDSSNYGIQVPESSERETPGQWLPPSPTFHGRRSPIGPCQNNCEDRRRPFVTRLWIARDRHVDLPDGHRTLANITGRNYGEAFWDLRRLHPPQEPSRRTPSLVSDDSHSHDSLSIIPPSNVIEDLPISPKLVARVAQASFQSSEYSEAASPLPFHSMEIDSTSKFSQKGNTGASVLHSSASPGVLREDVTKCIGSPVAYCASETSMPRSEAPTRLGHLFQNPESSRAVQKLDASTTQPPFQQPLCVAQSYTEEADSAKKKADDAYLPEHMPASVSGTRSRATKFSKSSSLKYKCPQCPRVFTRNFDMLRHRKNIHLTRTEEEINALTCTCCGEYLSRKDSFKRHVDKVPNSCIQTAKIYRKPAPALLSEETYATHKIAMMEVCTRLPS